MNAAILDAIGCVFDAPDGRVRPTRKGRPLVTVRPLTNDEARALTGEFLFVGRDGCVRRARVNGALKTWKRSPATFRLPVKYGFRECSYIANGETGYAVIEGTRRPVVALVEAR